jgi:uncharacterized protein (TIGR00725 family)
VSVFGQVPLQRESSEGSSNAEQPAAVFFGGVVVTSLEEETLAQQIGAHLVAAGFTLRHGGYNGLMEAAARGAARAGGHVVAVTLAGKEEWGPFNPHITDAVHLPTLGARLDHYFDGADLIVAMSGGIGSLHELTASLYYAGTIRPVPVWLVGPAATRLLNFLRQERWLFESPTRPLGFLSAIASEQEFTAALADLTKKPKAEA